MPIKVAWQLRDPRTLETYTFPQNPDKMMSGQRRRSFEAGYGITGGARVIARRVSIDWEFSGKLRTQAQYLAFLDWFNRPNPVVVIDHFGKERLLIPVSYEPIDGRSGKNPWLHSYTVKGRVLLKEFLSEAEAGWVA